MPNQYTTIFLPTRAQPDTVIAVFILKTFGELKFPGVKNAKITVAPSLPKGETSSSLEEKGGIAIDIGAGAFDHHASTKKTTASWLVAQALGVTENPALKKLLDYAERDDFYGKGTISSDQLDRAFGLSGLLVNLNKKFRNDPVKAFEIPLVLIEAHFEEELRRTEELPREFQTKVDAGEVEIFTVRQRDKNLKVVVLSSDNISLPGYLRSQSGGRFDIVAQKLLSGHMNILSRPVKRPDLKGLAREIRLAEAKLAGKILPADPRYLEKSGRIEEISEWYYDPATNSVQNGGTNPRDILPTRIPLKEFKEIISRGLSR